MSQPFNPIRIPAYFEQLILNSQDHNRTRIAQTKENHPMANRIGMDNEKMRKTRPVRTSVKLMGRKADPFSTSARRNKTMVKGSHGKM